MHTQDHFPYLYINLIENLRLLIKKSDNFRKKYVFTLIYYLELLLKANEKFISLILFIYYSR